MNRMNNSPAIATREEEPEAPPLSELESYLAQFRDSLVGMARSILRDAEEAADMVGGLTLRLIEKERDGSLPVALNYRAYFAQAIRNAALNKLRDLSRQTISIQRHQDTLTPDGAFHQDAEKIVGDKVRADRIRLAISGLIPIYREVLRLRYVEGLKTKEIARELKIEEGTVHSRLSRAREILKGKLLARDISAV